jgi:peptidoglycan/LPS O-acetylase OafA/YrhL
VPALDGVRGLAILIVLLYHFVAQTVATNRLEAGVNWALSYGPLGVDLFFILSGFLITGILYDSCAEPAYFRSFYMRRVLRIFPLYYAVLAVVFFVVPLIPALRGSEIAGLRQHQAWAWLYGVNVYLSIQGDWVLSYIEHFWSLAVEEHFYFVWPLVVWLLGARPRLLMKVALAIAAVCFGGHVAAAVAGVSPVVTMVLTPFQLDALCLGGFFAVYVRQPGGEAAVKRFIVPMALVALAVLLLQFGLHRFTGLGLPAIRSMRSAMFRLLLAALLLEALVAPASSVVSRFFRSAPMVALGKYSYGLYVYHHFFSFYFTRNRTEFALARAVGSHTLAVAIQAVGGMAVSMVIAWLSYEFFEKHFLRLKRFWPSSRAPAAAATP